MNRIVVFILILITMFGIGYGTEMSRNRTISYDEYCSLSNKYPQVILYNSSPSLAKYHGKLGENDSCLTAFLIAKDSMHFEILVQQEIFGGTDSLYLACFYEKIPDSTQLFVYSRAYSGSFILYEKPVKSQILNTLGYIVEPLFITDVKEEWLHICFTHEGVEYVGWIPKSECCANPYSTCN